MSLFNDVKTRFRTYEKEKAQREMQDIREGLDVAKQKQEVRKLKLERDKVNNSYKTPSFFEKVRENIPKPKNSGNSMFASDGRNNFGSNGNTARNIFGNSSGNARKKIFGK
jgi:hypothetical protein